eukprot:NODE_2134_length_2286_cov_2.549328.p1 GENE.NODE_2134_length_2286_cov_2.549328~~NODE_2134_length_2286_cov_2.549328.p1  ORF type:complete len:398 (-),score=120.87 NODE_2134_length_2286_cov_2.549328:1093-2130(-)
MDDGFIYGAIGFLRSRQEDLQPDESSTAAAREALAAGSKGGGSVSQGFNALLQRLERSAADAGDDPDTPPLRSQPVLPGSCIEADGVFMPSPEDGEVSCAEVSVTTHNHLTADEELGAAGVDEAAHLQFQSVSPPMCEEGSVSIEASAGNAVALQQLGASEGSCDASDHDASPSLSPSRGSRSGSEEPPGLQAWAAALAEASLLRALKRRAIATEDYARAAALKARERDVAALMTSCRTRALEASSSLSSSSSSLERVLRRKRKAVEEEDYDLAARLRRREVRIKTRLPASDLAEYHASRLASDLASADGGVWPPPLAGLGDSVTVCADATVWAEVATELRERTC